MTADRGKEKNNMYSLVASFNHYSLSMVAFCPENSFWTWPFLQYHHMSLYDFAIVSFQGESKTAEKCYRRCVNINFIEITL